MGTQLFKKFFFLLHWFFSPAFFVLMGEILQLPISQNNDYTVMQKKNWWRKTCLQLYMDILYMDLPFPAAFECDAQTESLLYCRRSLQKSWAVPNWIYTICSSQFQTCSDHCIPNKPGIWGNCFIRSMFWELCWDSWKFVTLGGKLNYLNLGRSDSILSISSLGY